MTYDELKEVDRLDTIIKVIEEGTVIKDSTLSLFPLFPDVIIFGDEAWKTNEGIAQFIADFVHPVDEKCVSRFFQEIALRIVSDPYLDDNDTRKNLHVKYRLLYNQHYSLFKKPDALSEWAEMRGVYFWHEYIIQSKRAEQFKRIIKKQDDDELFKISYKIKRVYGFTDREITYLQYFCSQAKLNDLDSSLNVALYNWSKKKKTGKSTVSE